MFEYKDSVERWGMQEISIEGKSGGNPFVDYSMNGQFVGPHESVDATGFYDGDGIYRIRFMPSYIGKYTFNIQGSFSDERFSGSFEVTEPSSKENHGPVHVCQQYHFAYADGMRYLPFGTTCYAWELQPEQIQRQTLATLAKGYFNKIRFCIFPKHYIHNLKDPIAFPYEGVPMDSSILTVDNFKDYEGDAPGNTWDFTRFNTNYFRHIDDCIAMLGELGIEADIILFHPYDRWGFSLMSHENDILYLKYVLARFSAYRNVWWSLANEYDLMKKSTADWEGIARTILEYDPYDHLRSIHNCIGFYDHTRPWITHACLQRQDIYKTTEYTDIWRSQFRKPVIVDEMAYEGNIEHGWGNISGQELVRRFWQACMRGGYGGHGETYIDDEDVLWWSHGGPLHGTAPERLRFLRDIMTEIPGCGLKYLPEGAFDDTIAVPEERPYFGQYYLYYYDLFRTCCREFHFDDEHMYKAELIDTWEMTIKEVGRFTGRFKVQFPGKEYMALRITRV